MGHPSRWERLKQNVSVQPSTIRIRLRGRPPSLALRRLSPAKITAWPHTPPLLAPISPVATSSPLCRIESTPRRSGHVQQWPGWEEGIPNRLGQSHDTRRRETSTVLDDVPSSSIDRPPLALVEIPSHSGWKREPLTSNDTTKAEDAYMRRPSGRSQLADRYDHDI